jgi:phosphatidylserine/phosphatidylglycerophosphate/cardiolipin synthase-like enzyme
MRVTRRCRPISPLFLLLLLSLPRFPAHASDEFDARARVYFSPNGGAQQAILQEINQARIYVAVQAYYFTSAPIAQALLRARVERGVTILLMVDDINQTDADSFVPWLLSQNRGIEAAVDHHSGIAHNKIMIIDDRVVITGSYNFTAAAEERNAENLLILTGSGVVNNYVSGWYSHYAHLLAYVSRQTKIRTP